MNQGGGTSTTDYDELELYLQQAQEEIGQVFNNGNGLTGQIPQDSDILSADGGQGHIESGNNLENTTSDSISYHSTLTNSEISLTDNEIVDKCAQNGIKFTENEGLLSSSIDNDLCIKTKSLSLLTSSSLDHNDKVKEVSEQICMAAQTSVSSPQGCLSGNNRCANTVKNTAPYSKCNQTVSHGSFNVSKHSGNVNEGHDLNHCPGAAGTCELAPVHRDLSGLVPVHLKCDGYKCSCSTHTEGSLSEKGSQGMMEVNTRDMEISVSECQESGSNSGPPPLRYQETHFNEDVESLSGPGRCPVIQTGSDLCDEIDGFITEITESMDDLLKADKVNSNQEVSDHSSKEVNGYLCHSDRNHTLEKENKGKMRENILINHTGCKCARGFNPNDKIMNSNHEQKRTCGNEHLDEMCNTHELKHPMMSVSQPFHTNSGGICVEKGRGYVNEKTCDRGIGKDEKGISKVENTPIKTELTDFDDTSLTPGDVVETDLGYYWLTSTIEEKSPGSVYSPSDKGTSSKCENVGKCSEEDLFVESKIVNMSKKLCSEILHEHRELGNNKCDKDRFSTVNTDKMSTSDCQGMSPSVSTKTSQSRKSESDMLNPLSKASEIMSSFEPKFLSLDRAVLNKKRGSHDDSHLMSVSDESLTVRPLRRKYSAPPSFCKVYKVISIDIPKMDSYGTLDKSTRKNQRRNSSEVRKRGSSSGLSRNGSSASIDTSDSLRRKHPNTNTDVQNQKDSTIVVGSLNEGSEEQINGVEDIVSRKKIDEVVNPENSVKKVEKVKLKVPVVDKKVKKNRPGNVKCDEFSRESVKSGENSHASVKQKKGLQVTDLDIVDPKKGLQVTDLDIVDPKKGLQVTDLDIVDPEKGLQDTLALIKDIEQRLDINGKPALKPKPKPYVSKDGLLTNQNMQPTMVWDPGVPKVPPRTYINKQGQHNKHLTLPSTPPPPSPHTTEQLITNMLNGHVTDLGQEKAPPLPERKRIVNTASVKKIENKVDRNVVLKSDQEGSRKQHDIKGVSRTNLKDKHKKMVNRLSGSHMVIGSLKEKRNTRDMLEVLESYKFVENFGENKESRAMETVNSSNQLKVSSMTINTTGSLDRRKSKPNVNSAGKDIKHVDNNISGSKNQNTANTAHKANVHEIKNTKEAEVKSDNDPLVKHLHRNLANKPQSYSEGMKNTFEPSAEFQVMVNSLSPVLLRRSNSNRSVKKHAGSVETSPESTPDVSPRSDHGNKDKLTNPKDQQESLFIDPEMARTWHGATSLNWSKHYGPQMKAMMRELESLGDEELDHFSEGVIHEDSDYEMGSKTLPSKSLLDQMHTKFCSDQYNNNAQESTLARELVLLKLKSQPIVKPKRSQSFNIRMGTGKSSSSLNSNGSPLLKRVHKRVGIKTRPDFQYSPKPTRAIREGTPDRLPNIPVIKVPDSKREEADGTKLSIHTILTLACLLMAVMSPVAESTLVPRLNYGVIFRRQSEITLSREYWLHTYEIPLPKFRTFPAIGSCHNNNNTCLLTSHVLSQLNALRLETDIRLNQTLQTIHALVPHTNITQKSRTKRALLPFIGTLSKSIFGTATMGDVNTLASHINALNKRTQNIADELVQHNHHISSFMQKSNERMDNLLLGIKENNKAIHLVTTELQETSESLQHTFEQMTYLLVHQLKTSAQLNHQLDELKLGITNLANGKLSPLIIPFGIMQSTLNDVQDILTTKYSGFFVAIKSASEIYQHSNFLYTRNKSTLYVTVKIPISYSKDSLDLYEIISKPVPVNETSKHATQILDLPDYFAITKNQQFYIHMSQSHIDTCSGSKHKYCHLNLPLQPVLKDACTLALYANDKTKVLGNCNFRYITNIIEPQIIELSSNQVLLYDTDVLSMECKTKHTMVKGCNFCMFDLPCHCSLSSPHFYLPPRLISCKDVADKLTKLHPVNLVLLQQFFDNDKFQHIFADTTFKNPLKVTLPQFKLYNHKLAGILANDQKNHLNLSKMVEVAKNDQVVFQSLAEPLIEGQIQLQTTWPDLNGILALIAVCLTGIATLLLVYLFCKVRKLSALLLLLQLSTQAKALPSTMPSFVYQSTTTPANDNIFNFDIMLTWEHANFMLLSLNCLLILIILIRSWKSNNTTWLMLELTNMHECIFVHVLPLPMCPSHVDINIPEDISNIRIINNWFRFKMKISWPNFNIVNPINNQTIQVPECITINPFQARTLARILKTPFFVHLYCNHNGHLLPLSDKNALL